MTTMFGMSRAQVGDLATVMGLLDQRTSWLRERGSDQWSTREFQPLMEEAIEQGFTWLLHDNTGTAVATLTMNTLADTDFWTPREAGEPAFYLSKLATSMEMKGQGIGHLLIRWAAAYARAHCVSMLRWDVWRTNTDLQNYYRSTGARYLRTEEVPGRRSGALFEQWTHGEDLTNVRTENQLASIAQLGSEPQEPPVLREVFEDRRDNSRDIEPGTRFVRGWPISGLEISSTNPPSAAAAPYMRPPVARPMYITPRRPVVLFNPGTGWRVHSGHGSPAVEVWPSELNSTVLRPGHAYLVRITDDHSRVEVVGDKGLGELA